MKPFTSLRTLCTALLAAVWLAAPGAGAQESSEDAVEIDRDAAALIDALRERPHDPDVADTALVFTNFGDQRARVLCVGFDKHGNALGRVVVHLPRLGLRYVLASDLAHEVDFVGSVQCGTQAGVRGSAVFLGPGLTDLPVEQIPGSRAGRIRFPLVATY